MNRDDVPCSDDGSVFLSSFEYVLNWSRQFGLYFIFKTYWNYGFFFNVFDVSLSPRPHLFDQKYSNIAKYYCSLNTFLYILKCNFFLWWQSWIFSIITPVFSVTWSFRNHSNMLICAQETFPHLWKPHYGNGNFIYIALFTTTRVDQCALQ